MALATQCPHCHTKFRVAADQLKLRGGIVRCGACQSIFDGSAHLIDLDAVPRKDETPEPAPASDLPTDLPTPAETDTGEGADLPIYTLDLGHTLDPLGILPKAVAADEEPEAAAAPEAAPTERIEPSLEEPETEPAPDFTPPPPEPEPAGYAQAERIEPSFGLPVDEELVAQALPGVDEEHGEHEEHEAPAATPPAAEEAAEPVPPPPAPAPADAEDVPPAALPLRASAGGPVAASIPPPPPTLKRTGKGSKNVRRSKLTPTPIEAPKLRVPDSDEPEFVKRSRREEQTGRTRRILLGVGAAVLLLVLLLQTAVTFRAALAARYPAMKPLLGAVCAPLGCRVGLPARVENLAIETGELSPLGPDTYTLNTLLRNQGSLVQAWPSIELELIDDDNKPLLRRVFGPAEYLAPAQLAGGFGAHAEQPVRLDFALAGLKPAGYHLFVFYP